MIHKLYLKQVEAWKEIWDLNFKQKETYLGKGMDELKLDAMRTISLSSRHKDTIELLEAEIERKKGLRKEKPKGKCMNLENHLHGSCFECKKIDGFNEAIDEDISYLEEQLKLIKKEI